MMPRRIALLLALLLPLGPSAVRGGDPPVKPGPNSDQEPMAEQFSLERGGRFLDKVSVDWTRKRQCGTCHTNYAQMMATPTLGGPASPELAEVRAFFETRAAGWDKAEKSAKPIGDGEVVATARRPLVSRLGDDGEAPPLDPRRARPDVDDPTPRRRLELV